MGLALVLLQAVEKILRLAMTFVLQKGDSLTSDMLRAQEAAERAKTLGYFLSELRKRASLDDSLDALLTEFLKNRNDFIHDLSRVPGWNLQGDTAAALTFVRELISQAERVMKVFTALILVWQERTGLTAPETPHHDWFRSATNTYGPIVDDLFMSKDA